LPPPFACSKHWLSAKYLRLRDSQYRDVHASVRRFNPLLAMLRVKYVVVMENSVMEIHPAPVAADTQGRASIVREGTDFMEVDADVASPSILEGSSQKSYPLMPANYALRAVALDRGKHRPRLEWAAWLVAAFLPWRRERRLARA